MNFRKASWILLTLLGSFIIFASTVSMYFGYTQAYDIGGVDVVKVAAGREEVERGLRGIRGTSAAYGGAFGVLFLAIVTGPYRRGEIWAWWALLASLLVPFVFVLLRIPMIGTSLGVNAAIQQLVVGGFCLLLDVSRLRAPAANA